MSEFFTPEHNEKFLEECIAKLRTQIAHEQEDHHHHIGWIEYNCRRQIRDAQLDFADLVEQMLAGETEQGDGSPLDWDSLKLIQTLGPDLDRKREKTRQAISSITIDNPGSGYPPGGYGFSPAKGGSDA